MNIIKLTRNNAIKYFGPHAKRKMIKVIDPVSLYSMSEYSHSKFIARSIKKLYGKKIKKQVLLDANSHVGGNLNAMIPLGLKTHAVEIDTDVFKLLKWNMKQLHSRDKKLSKVKFINDDIITQSKINNNITVAFFDPPWCGKDYKYKTNMSLGYGECDANNPDFTNVIDVMQNLVNTNPITTIVLKAPFNYEFSQLKIFAKKSGLNRWLDCPMKRVDGSIIYHIIIITSILKPNNTKI